MEPSTSNPTPPPQEILSPTDVDRLLSEVADPDPAVSNPASEKDTKQPDKIEAYDFRQPAFLSANDLRKLRLRYEDFIRSLAARLSIYLRLEFGLEMSKLHTLRFQKFTEGLANPTHLTMFKVEPLRGICLLDIPQRLGLTIVDRLLGGPALSVNAARELSEIEVGLLDQAIQMILGEWCNHWTSLMNLKATLLGHETNGRFLQTSPHDTLMFILAMEARVGDCVDMMQIAIPYYTLEPLVLKLNTLLDTSDKSASTPATAPVRWNSLLDDVAIPVTAEWSEIEVTARQLAQLKIGDVLPLPAKFAEQVRLRLAKLPKFVGCLGTRGGNWAVELTQVLKS
ncbi:MAG: FliM/FliN family flagellar motor switch protein [Verrucomicrobiota bacterium]